MAEVLIKYEDFASLTGKVVVVTGGSSGIGLSTVRLLLLNGALVVNGDLQQPVEAVSSEGLIFHKTDVTVWSEVLSLFKKAKEVYGRIDHAFANAGISPRGNYLATDLDENGDLKEPNSLTIDVNLKGVMNVTTVAIYYIRQTTGTGSVVMTASIASMQRFRAVDYATAKHGVLGYMRAMRQVLEEAKLPIRVNALAPSWTETGVVPSELLHSFGEPVQSPDDVAPAALLLMADTSRHGHVIHVAHGKFKEVDEAVLLPAYEKILGGAVDEDTTLQRMLDAMNGVYKDKM